MCLLLFPFPFTCLITWFDFTFPSYEPLLNFHTIGNFVSFDHPLVFHFWEFHVIILPSYYCWYTVVYTHFIIATSSPIYNREKYRNEFLECSSFLHNFHSLLIKHCHYTVKVTLNEFCWNLFAPISSLSLFLFSSPNSGWKIIFPFFHIPYYKLAHVVSLS